MGDTLILKPDADVPSEAGKYVFYAGQIITLCATLTRSEGEITGGESVYFSKIGKGFGDVSVRLEPYDEQGWTYVGNQIVSVKLVPSSGDPSVGTAKLRVIVYRIGQLDPDGYTVTASLDPSGSGAPSADLTYVPAENAQWGIPILQSGMYLPSSDQDHTPSSSLGSYIRYQFEAVDPKGVGIPHMLVRIRSYYLSQTIHHVLIYDRFDCKSPDEALEVKGSPGDEYIDLLTDKTGFAEIFLCAKGGEDPQIDEISGTVGIYDQNAGLFIASTFDPGGENGLSPPKVTEPVQLDDGDDSTDATIQYKDMRSSDKVYLFCNYQYQGSRAIDSNGDPADISIEKYGMRSTDYGAGQPNVALYFSLRANWVGASTRHDFIASGNPPAAHPPAADTNLPPPTVADDPDGWPINCGILSTGLRLRASLSGTDIEVGDAITMIVYLNGYRMSPDDDEPLGAIVQGPYGLYVTQRMMDLGYAEWWFPPRSFMGYGQKGNGKKSGANGDLGTLEAQYMVSDGISGVGEQRRTYKYISEVLTLGLDTIPPSGDMWSVWGESEAYFRGRAQDTVTS